MDQLGRDENGADLALGKIDWTPGRVLTLATESVTWGERVETYGYPFSTVVPDQLFSACKSVAFSPVFLRGYVSQVVPNMNGRPAMHLDMLSPPGLSGAPASAKPQWTFWVSWWETEASSWAESRSDSAKRCCSTWSR